MIRLTILKRRPKATRPRLVVSRPFRAGASALLATALMLAACSGDDGTETATETQTTLAAEQSTTTTAATTTTTEATTTTTEAVSVAASDAALPACGAPKPGADNFSFSSGGQDYAIRLFSPTTMGTDRLPVVLNWHGLGSDGFQQSQLSGYEVLAEKENFIAVHPSGIPAPGDTRKSWELLQLDIDPDRDDVAMVSELIDKLVADHCANPARIYSTGLSNGGFFTSRLICELSDRIAAGVSVAGVSHHDECEPTTPTPFMAFHGTDDEVVPYEGGTSALADANSPPGAKEFFKQNMAEEFAEYTADFGCAAASAVEALTPEVARTVYEDCGDSGFPLIFHEIKGGGHTWPGSPFGLFLTESLGVTTYDIDATAEGWAFMSQYELD